MSLVTLSDIKPISGFLTGPNPTKTAGYFIAIAISFSVWSVTPLAWLTVLAHVYKKGTLLSLPTKGILAKIWYIYCLFELPFSVYLKYLHWVANKRREPPEFDLDRLQTLLTKSLTAGLSLSSPKKSEKAEVATVRHRSLGLKPNQRGLHALKAYQVDETEAETKRSRLRAWFHFAPLQDIYEDNVREWLAWAFTGRDLQDARQNQDILKLLDEGIEMVKIRMRWPDVQPGYNHNVKCIRLTLDPIQALSRPLGYYFVTNYVTQGTIFWLCTAYGFRYETSGDCAFLVKDGQKASFASNSLPIVFLHGLGIGLGQYITMLQTLARHSHGVVILIQPHISTGIYSSNFLNPPTKDQQARATVDILQRHNMLQATTLSHSNGTMVLGWLLRTAPQMFPRNILVDPVSFCMWEGCECDHNHITH